MLEKKRASGMHILEYRLYARRLIKQNSLRKRSGAINQLVTLLGSKDHSRKALFKATATKTSFLKELRIFIFNFFCINFAHIKSRLILSSLPGSFLQLRGLSLKRFLRLYGSFDHLYTSFFKNYAKYNLAKYRNIERKNFINLYSIFFEYIYKFQNKLSHYDSLSDIIDLDKRGSFSAYQPDTLEDLLRSRYSFTHNVKSKRVIRFLAKIAYVFKRTPRSRYRKILRPFRLPFRIGTKTTNFYLQHQPNKKTISYNDYRSLKLFFGGLKPQGFWKNSREANTKDTLGWSFLKKYSYLDFRLDYLLSRIGFANNIFEGKTLVDSKKIMVNGHITQTNDLGIKPYDWIEVVGMERLSFKLNYLTRLVLQRTQNYNLKSIPGFIEINWDLFRFFILPTISPSDMARPYKTFNYHVGGGKKQPAKLS